MDLEFSEEEAELRHNVRSVLAGICPPAVVRAVYDEKVEPGGVWEKMVELDWPALGLPEEHGGLGMGFLELSIVAEELGRATVPSPFLATVTQFAPCVRDLGDDGQRDHFLTGVAAGRVTGTLAVAEGGRWTLDAVRARADPAGGGAWVLHGQKESVFDGATADEVVVVARAEAGLGAFVVPRRALVVRQREVIDPTLPVADIVLDGVEVPADRVLAPPGTAGVERSLDRVLEEATVSLATAAVGTCRAIFDTTLAYVKVREQYGRPIGSFQALKHRLADMYLAVERATSLCYFAALTIAEEDPRRTEAASLAKVAVGGCQRLVVGEGLQMHGGIGFTWEHDLHFLLKRAKSCEALFGTALDHRSRLARHLGLAASDAGGGVKLTFDEGVEDFRAEFLAWLAEHRPSESEMAEDPARSSAHVPGWARRWTRRLFDGGWLVPGWPPERGGRNAGPIETLVYSEELTRANIPRTTNPQGLGIVAPSIFDYGSDAQVRDYAMPILRGERSACLGMSEPGAGSDLASLGTRAVLDGDQFVINGQKVWTSGANYADFCFLFCRTDTTVAKHKGISVVLVGMDTPGITVRPLPEIIGPEHPDLNEVFFADVVVPRENLVGELNNGWAMANGSLAHERGMVWLTGVLGLEEDMARLLAEAPARLALLPPAERAVVGDRIVECYVDSVAARCLGYRGFAKLVRGGTAPEQALMKVFSSESSQRMSLVASEMMGDRSVDMGPAAAGIERAGSWMARYFRTFGSTISAGSSEIQRNIIAERVLGLPREPKPAKVP